jgi:gliding motility-associated-like protein
MKIKTNAAFSTLFTTFLIIFTYILPTNVTAQIDVSGYWQGVTYQPVGGSTECYPVTIFFIQNGNTLTGTSYTYIEGTDYFAEMNVAGTLSGNQIDYIETEITDKNDAPGFEWCLGEALLSINVNTQTITGTMEGVTESGWPCEDAFIEIYRLQIMSPLVYCEPGTKTISVDGQNIRWYSDENLNNLIATGNSLTRNITQTTSFFVTQTTTFCSTPSPAAEVKVVISNLTLNANIVAPTCTQTGSLTGIASGGLSPFQFSLNNSAFQPSGSFLSLSPGNYELTVRDGSGCERTQTFIVPTPSPLAVGTDANPSDCNQANGMAMATASAGVAPFSFVWNNGATEATLLNIPAGIYSVTVTDANGCTGSNSINVLNAGNAPNLSLESTNTQCGAANGAISATVTGGQTPFSFLWSNGATTSQLQDVVAGNYELTVTDATGCSVSGNNLIEPSLPLTMMFLEDTVSVIAGQTTNLKPLLSVADSTLKLISWSPANALSCSDCLNPIANPTVSTSYQLIVTDKNDCSTTGKVFVEVIDTKPVDFYIPNAFSPNDDGVNDFFEINLPSGIEFKTMQIFDRWGELVFQSNNPQNAWDGSYKGKLMPLEVYIYVLNYASSRAVEKELSFSGDVTVIR